MAVPILILHIKRKGNRFMTTSWKQWLILAKQASHRTGGDAYETAVNVHKLWESKEFLTTPEDEGGCGNVLDTKSGRLSEFSGSWALDLSDMLLMINHFPLKKDWEHGRLDRLKREAKALQKKHKPSRKIPNPRSPIEERLAALLEENRELKAEVRKLKRKLRIIERVLGRSRLVKS